LYCILACCAIALYIYLLVLIVKRTFQEKHPNRYSNVVLLFVLGFIALFYILPFSQFGLYLLYPVSYWDIVFIAAWGLITLIGAWVLKPSTERPHNAMLQRGIECANGNTIDTLNFSYSGEVRRKALHIMALITLFAFSVGVLIFWLVSDKAYASMGALNTPEQLYSVAWISSQSVDLQGLMTFNVGMFGAFMVQANCEILRLRYSRVNFALKRTLQKTRRASEARSFGAHMSMLPGFLFGAIFLTYWSDYFHESVMAVFALVIVSTFGDLMAAIIGRRYGKHKWQWFPGKSKEGTLAGSMASFFGALVFVGPLLAMVSDGVFVFTDLIMGKARI
jgi:dolichol kinase